MNPVKLTGLVCVLISVLCVLNSCALTDFLFGTPSETEVSGISVDVSEDTSVETKSPEGPDETGGTGEDSRTPDDTNTPAVSTGSSDTEATPKALFLDPLTGLWTENDYSSVRPVSIIIDNISAASPQSGISRADIMIECMAEGGISRLILITNKYSANEVYGPVRSIRDYMVSLSQAFGTLMVGAGYSPTGYTAIFNNALNYIDGTHDRYASSGFFRDPQRYASAGYEHSLMITGTGIKALAAHNNFSLVTAYGKPVLNFVEKAVAQTVDVTSSATDSSAIISEPVVTSSDKSEEAVHTILTYSSTQQIQLIYSRSEDAYYRYQFGIKSHCDAENGQQLRFENVFILFAKQSLITGDEAGRLNVQTTGTGTGYFLCGGKYIPITWSRSDILSSFVFKDEKGNDVELTPGKTFITVMDSTKKNTSSVILNYRVEKSEPETTAVPEMPASPEEIIVPQ